MHDRRKSDGPVVPAKPSNNAGRPAAEVVEERGPAKGNATSETRPGRRAGLSVSSDLDRVRQVARKDKDARFTALLHHVTIDCLEAAYRTIRPGAAPGVDGVTWKDYGQDLEANLRDLHARVHRGAYRARPSRRVYIPKPDGRQRPLGVAALEDKILQRAVAEVLNAIYECDFLGFSYGFRPGRSQHDALDALAVAITKRRVSWILDADIRDYFSKLDHSRLEKFLEHRIADRRVLRLIQKWLRAGVVEDGAWTACDEGTPQGASISTLLSNVYLHYVFDLWVHQWRGRHARGELIVVRFADDAVAGTSKKRLRAKLREVKTELMQRRHDPIPDQGRWLASVVRGHSNYYAVPGNIDAVAAFHNQAVRHWRRALRRRSQRTRLTWERMKRLDHRWLPTDRILHPWPDVRFDARTRGRSPVR
jgi:RNA-directed DNA polymerase